jgi:large subunit ribosomal protein L9
MNVILKEDMNNLGLKDDVVAVKPGYGRNYLIPKGFAILATPTAKKIHEENLRQRAHKLAGLKDEALKMAAQLENKKLTIGAKTSSTGKIFGSVNTIQIAEAIAKKGFEIDRKNIKIDGDTIKEVGTYTAHIKLHREVSVDIEFKVVSE